MQKLNRTNQYSKMKFALFLILGLCAFQKFEVHSKEIQNVHDIVDNITLLLRGFQDLVSHLKNVISDLVHEIQTVMDKVTAVIYDLIPDTESEILNFENKIKKIIDSGNKGKQCVEDYQQEIDNLVQQIKDGLGKCVQAAKDDASNLKDPLVGLNGDMLKFNDDISDTVLNCTISFQLDDLLKCLEDENKAANIEFMDFQQKVGNAIKSTKDQLPIVVQHFEDCLYTVLTDARYQESNIIQKINDCTNS